jgi:hypothetical protein
VAKGTHGDLIPRPNVEQMWNIEGSAVTDVGSDLRFRAGNHDLTT